MEHGIIAQMSLRKATPGDWPQILELARKYDLDYHGMQADDFWVAVAGERIEGICGLKKHPDCLELCSLGVDKSRRGRGLGKRLVLELLKTVPEDLYLATVIPAFFEKFGFEKTDTRPASMLKKADWCRDCRPELCTVMVRKGS
jgi:N-acetylglutamate synthase-like GNAT family acetyltransferase